MSKAGPVCAGRDPAPWLHGRVPDGFWSSLNNRRSYMDWLANTCGFSRPEDWHCVTKRHFHENRGGGLLANYYRDSPILAVREYHPHYPWKLWLFQCVPQGFWQAPKNRRAYMDWLGAQLGYITTSDWYQIVKEDFRRYAGAGLLYNYYDDSPIAAVYDYRPDYPWKAWLFSSVPQGYWQNPRHRRQYMDWLGARLGLEQPEDWYLVKRRHFAQHRGGGLLATVYADSPLKALREYFPDFEWDATRFQAGRTRELQAI